MAKNPNDCDDSENFNDYRLSQKFLTTITTMGAPGIGPGSGKILEISKNPEKFGKNPAVLGNPGSSGRVPGCPDRSGRAGDITICYISGREISPYSRENSPGDTKYHNGYKIAVWALYGVIRVCAIFRHQKSPV
jgi:hypothetical protein